MRTRRMNGTNSIVPSVNGSFDWGSFAGDLLGAGVGVFNSVQTQKAAPYQAQIAASNASAAQAAADKAAADSAAQIAFYDAQKSASSGGVSQWWAARSNVEKGLIIGGTVLAVGGGIYLYTRSKKKRRK